MEEIDVKEIFNILWNKKIAIILIVTIFVIIGIIYTKTMITPKYKSSSTLVLVKNTNEEGENIITQTEVTLNQKLVATYTELIKSSKVVRKVIKNLNIEMEENTLKGNITVKLITNTQLIEIAVTNENPELAKQLTDEIVNVFKTNVQEIYKIDNINIIDEAKVPTVPYNINMIKNIVVFAMIGIIIAGVYIFIISLMDTTIKDAEKAEKQLGLTILAQIPQYDYDMKKKGGK